MSRDSAKAHYSKQPGDPDEGYITASDAQAAIDDIYDDMAGLAVIADGSVTTAKIASDAVTSAQIAANAVGSSELADNAVTSAKIASGAVSSILLSVRRAAATLDGGTAFAGADSAWDVACGDQICDCGGPSDTASFTFDGGAAA